MSRGKPTRSYVRECDWITLTAGHPGRIWFAMSNHGPEINDGAKKLKEWRTRRGINQAAAAAEVGIPQPRYCEYENGVKIPNLGYSIKIREKTGIDGAEFLSLKKPKPAASAAA